MMIDPTGATETTPRGDEIFVVVALIQPFKLDSVALALEQIDSFRGMTVVECRGSVGDYAESTGLPKGGTDAAHRRRAGEQGLVELASRVRLEIIVRGEVHAIDIAETIARVAHTGRAGDGFVSTALLANLIRIRTMETGVDGI